MYVCSQTESSDELHLEHHIALSYRSSYFYIRNFSFHFHVPSIPYTAFLAKPSTFQNEKIMSIKTLALGIHRVAVDLDRSFICPTSIPHSPASLLLRGTLYISGFNRRDFTPCLFMFFLSLTIHNNHT